MTTKERLHRLVDLLPEREEPIAERVLEALSIPADAMRRSLADVPWDDEPEGEEERAAMAEAYSALDRGEVVPHEKLDEELARLRRSS